VEGPSSGQQCICDFGMLLLPAAIYHQSYSDLGYCSQAFFCLTL
jgi:hypothetical protein